ncbi:histidinol-phosphate transaminase [Legionella impletisoli]|uniref:Histidinol-phosphate aminotransferase n=1 Tax=Legionella impletisoli TaxID=343510 RepID=A0A917JRK7_9GAMM|nr:histidinol-phosphate transaminase [Legionella impletisoli]GGI80334.1 histidinol-phosphate aminotransferase 2 [Legionella impletisoli]
MACDYHLLPHSGIQTLSPYIPGKSVEQLADELGLTDIIKLASNENPLGCSHKVTKALSALSGHAIAMYPSPYHSPLLQNLSAKLGVPTDMITLGNGTDMLFPLIINCFALHQEKQVLTHEYAFSSYAIYSKILGVPVTSTPVDDQWAVDIKIMAKACDEKTAIIFLPNPNNPTGVPVKNRDIIYLLEHIPESTFLVLDEAYVEYNSETPQNDSIELLQHYSNLIITRTFSKAYGLAGLRLGYAIARAEVTSLLKKISPPFFVNCAALVAANAALDDAQFIHETLTLNQQGLAQLKAGLKKLKLTCLPSSGNFITVDFKKDAGPLYQSLLRYGIIVRPLHPYRMDNFLRITVGTMQQNIRFLDALEECLNEEKL